MKKWYNVFRFVDLYITLSHIKSRGWAQEVCYPKIIHHADMIFRPCNQNHYHLTILLFFASTDGGKKSFTFLCKCVVELDDVGNFAFDIYSVAEEDAFIPGAFCAQSLLLWINTGRE